MDLLKAEDRAILAGVLRETFEPIGFGDRFVIIAVGADGRFMTIGIRDERAPHIEPLAIVQAVAMTEPTDEFRIEGGG